MSVVVDVDSSHMTASSSVSWSSFSPASDFVTWHMSTIWFMGCCWSQSQEGNWEDSVCAAETLRHIHANTQMDICIDTDTDMHRD